MTLSAHFSCARTYGLGLPLLAAGETRIHGSPCFLTIATLSKGLLAAVQRGTELALQGGDELPGVLRLSERVEVDQFPGPVTLVAGVTAAFGTDGCPVGGSHDARWGMHPTRARCVVVRCSADPISVSACGGRRGAVG